MTVVFNDLSIHNELNARLYEHTFLSQKTDTWVDILSIAKVQICDKRFRFNKAYTFCVICTSFVCLIFFFFFFLPARGLIFAPESFIEHNMGAERCCFPLVCTCCRTNVQFVVC